MSDQVILAVIGAAGSAFAVFMSFKVAELTKVARKTHEAVNSMSLILARRLSAVTSRLADITCDPKDIEAAADARKAMEQSEAVQEQLDTRKP